MDKDLEQAPDTQESQVDIAPAADNAASRRRFTRNAVIGSAVIFSLGNRAAWGSYRAEDTCVSNAMMASFVANGNQFASLRPGQLRQSRKIRKILRPSNREARYTKAGKTCLKS